MSSCCWVDYAPVNNSKTRNTHALQRKQITWYYFSRPLTVSLVASVVCDVSVVAKRCILWSGFYLHPWGCSLPPPHTHTFEDTSWLYTASTPPAGSPCNLWYNLSITNTKRLFNAFRISGVIFEVSSCTKFHPRPQPFGTRPASALRAEASPPHCDLHPSC